MKTCMIEVTQASYFLRIFLILCISLFNLTKKKEHCAVSRLSQSTLGYTCINKKMKKNILLDI